MSFTITCNECGSNNIAVDGSLDFIAVVTCKDCGQKKYDDEFLDSELEETA